ncbi:MFS transporter [Raineyella fluvialis]|uniref:MFS transporter n=1 Tax=Raineyella fluvialis TaxID=2662261 RepID=A0A5Q2F7H5_9ACTN|nr:MFS transporter [Raineyella fluvialis]QGF22421.1 MFS transporter [Raineyella fluvialis]
MSAPTVSRQAARPAGLSIRHTLVVVTGCMLTLGCSALAFSTWGLFQPLVAEKLGVTQPQFAGYITVMYLTMTAMSPLAGKVLQGFDIRLVLSAAALLVAGGFLLMSVATSIWVFYLAGIVMGAGTIFILWLAVPTLINRWFARRAGLLIGVCMAFTGVGGALWSAVFTVLTKSGWDFHGLYRLWAVIALLTSLPFTLFAVRGRPADVGLLPYGTDLGATGKAPAPRGLSAAQAMRSPVFYALCLGAGVINIAVLIAMQFPAYAKTLTDVPWDRVVVGGVMSSLMMTGQAIGKVTIGLVADRSPRNALLFAVSAAVAGVLLCWLGAGSLPLLYTGAFIFGFFYATALVLVPVLARTVFGVREYPIIYSRVSMVFNLIAAFASVFWATLGTRFGFSAVFGVGLALLAVVLLTCGYVVRSARAVQARWSE